VKKTLSLSRIMALPLLATWSFDARAPIALAPSSPQFFPRKLWGELRIEAAMAVLRVYRKRPALSSGEGEGGGGGGGEEEWAWRAFLNPGPAVAALREWGGDSALRAARALASGLSQRVEFCVGTGDFVLVDVETASKLKLPQLVEMAQRACVTVGGRREVAERILRAPTILKTVAWTAQLAKILSERRTWADVQFLLPPTSASNARTLEEVEEYARAAVVMRDALKRAVDAKREEAPAKMVESLKPEQLVRVALERGVASPEYQKAASAIDNLVSSFDAVCASASLAAMHAPAPFAVITTTAGPLTKSLLGIAPREWLGRRERDIITFQSGDPAYLRKRRALSKAELQGEGRVTRIKRHRPSWMEEDPNPLEVRACAAALLLAQAGFPIPVHQCPTPRFPLWSVCTIRGDLAETTRVAPDGTDAAALLVNDEPERGWDYSASKHVHMLSLD